MQRIESAQPFCHESVLPEEAIASLAIKPAGYYIDATFGRGGHTRAILSHLGNQGHLLAIDKDATAIAHAKACFAGDRRVVIRQGSFTQLAHWVQQIWPNTTIDGILFDLGVSSPQIDDANRGFSFKEDGPLDMRMDTCSGYSAADWLSVASSEEIAHVLRHYGEERYAKRIARAIVSQREQAPITRTLQLADLITKAVPRSVPHKHPATRSFQAIRIHINNELTDLETALCQAVAVLGKGGRLSVISFHSLEDRITKQFIRQQATLPDTARRLPVLDEQMDKITLRQCGKKMKPSAAELARNRRARSAILRTAEKIK